MAGTQTLEVSFIDGSIAVQMTQGGIVGLIEYYPICNVISITGMPQIGFAVRDPLTNQRAHRYPYDDMLRVVVQLKNEKQAQFQFEIQDVTNQAGWTADAAGLQQAQDDINAFMDSCCCISSAPVVDVSALNLEVTQQLVLTALQSILVDTTAIDANTDTLEALLTTLIADIGAFKTENDLNLDAVNVSLTSIISELQDIDANTVNLEARLDSIIVNTNSINLSTSAFEFTGAATGSSVANVHAVTFTCTVGNPIVNGVTRPTGFVITYEHDNDKIGAIAWDANGGTLQIDYVL